MLEYCTGCLSTNRRLTKIRFLSEKMDLGEVNIAWKNMDKICWECETKMVNFINFKKQVLRAQSIMKLWQKSVKDRGKLESLSTLSVCMKTFYDCVINEDDTQDNIKQEIDVELTEKDCLVEEDNGEPSNLVMKEETSLFDKNCDGNEDFDNRDNDQDSIEADDPHCLPTSTRQHEHSYQDNDSEPVTFKCKQCNLSFQRIRQLRYHRDKAHSLTKCEVCGKRLATKYNLKIHMRLHSSAGFDRHQCSLCGGRYRQLAAHMRTHAPPAQDAYCAECGLTFRSQLTYKNHLAMAKAHRKENALKHVCDSCGAAFCTASSLAMHTAARHTRVHRFACDNCGKGYHRKDRLRDHVLEVHEGVQLPKKNICNFCGKAFKEKRVLMNHVRTHTGARPHACLHCAAKFTQRVALTTHCRAKHKDKIG